MMAFYLPGFVLRSLYFIEIGGKLRYRVINLPKFIQTSVGARIGTQPNSRPLFRKYN